jgi:hypothetical protein
VRRLDVHVTSLLAGAGIIQSASDPVHERQIDGESLAVIPCVTLYPGMERLFDVVREDALSPRG